MSPSGDRHAFMIKTNPYMNSTDLLFTSTYTTDNLEIGGAYSIYPNYYDFDWTDFYNFLDGIPDNGSISSKQQYWGSQCSGNYDLQILNMSFVTNDEISSNSTLGNKFISN